MLEQHSSFSPNFSFCNHRCSRWRRKCASCLRKLRVIKG